jgi:hypothetical protein
MDFLHETTANMTEHDMRNVHDIYKKLPDTLQKFVLGVQCKLILC